MNETTSITLQ